MLAPYRADGNGWCGRALGPGPVRKWGRVDGHFQDNLAILVLDIGKRDAL
jgi:hypothetical protein